MHQNSDGITITSKIIENIKTNPQNHTAISNLSHTLI